MERYPGFREFVEARRGALSRTAFFLTGDTSAAEDLLQEALTKTVARWGNVTAGGYPEAYVKQVMLNEIRTRWRRRQRRLVVSVADVPDQPHDGDVSDAVDRTALARALRQLAPRQRAALYLRYYEDRSYADIARLLDCSVGTVKSQLHGALERLRVIAPELLADAELSEVLP
ncbi:SigE family RNA polymerase sigma factor [Tenggerimyces flavus]|uniref:SigE family RNA polymerase sigma factor n=1 Tax=Tenggerimyces flavus TaxID=1708749 RepID=A0ABV7YEK3_9ACTN|nr:SigE family RNA polymerase sigma factor [Tenggerimyces flavus]MBM7786730.1 RNA polymerase sigma-70 factor (sigma-E family) [Tenggerimyces flavus]